MKYGYSRFLPITTLVIDILSLNIALAVVLFFYRASSDFYAREFQFYTIFNLSWLFISLLSRNFIFHRPLVLSDNISKLLTSVGFHLLLVVCSLYFAGVYDISRYILLLSCFLFFMLLVVQRSILFFLLDFVRKRGFNQRRILLLGDEEIASRIKRSFRFHPEYGYKVTAFLPRDGMQNYPEERLKNIIEEESVHELYLCYKEINNAYIDKLLKWFDGSEIKIKIVSDLTIDPLRTSLLRLYDFPVLSLLAKPSVDLKIRVLKRGFDLVFSSIVMLVGAPVFLLLIIGTKFTSKGPIFYKQQRMGRNGLPFSIYKFRSMYVDAEKYGPQLAKESDPRVTSWGRVIRKTRLDELPQFYNVFIGDMSVVGPRPERQHFIEQILAKAPSYKKLLLVKPGITSLGQIKFGYAENVDEMVQRMRYDLLYLNNRKLHVDMRIIAGTIRVMVQGKGK